MIDFAGTEAPLLEASAAGRVLDLSASRVRGLADAGVLRVAARTSTGGRLFDPRDVEALARARRHKREAAPQPEARR